MCSPIGGNKCPIRLIPLDTNLANSAERNAERNDWPHESHLLGTESPVSALLAAWLTQKSRVCLVQRVRQMPWACCWPAGLSWAECTAFLSAASGLLNVSPTSSASRTMQALSNSINRLSNGRLPRGPGALSGCLGSSQASWWALGQQCATYFATLSFLQNCKP
jgi:hypothetical protein